MPHFLVEAFKSTLEETLYADVVLHIVNAADPREEEQKRVVEELLIDMGRKDAPILTAYNQADKLPISLTKGREGIFISAKTGFGLEELLKRIAKALPNGAVRKILKIPYNKGELTAKIRQNGKIFSESFCEDGVLLDALVEESLLYEVAQYETEVETD